MKNKNNQSVEKTTIDKIVLPDIGIGLREITLEITNGCNLKCIHCYAESDNYSSSKDTISEEKWKNILDQAKELGTTNIQISGGEPTTCNYAGDLLKYANNLEFKMVKLYTNGFKMPENIINDIKESNALVKVTFFSYDPQIHDEITTKPGSHKETSENIIKMHERGIRLRAGIVLTPINNFSGNLERTIEYLNELGIEDVRHDYMHGVGRGYDLLKQEGYEALCGMCWTGKLTINSEGYVHPCVMSRFVDLGNVHNETLSEIMKKPELMEFRKTIYSKFGDLRIK